MSGKLMGQVYGLVLTRSERDVLLALADHADDDGRNARPGVGFIAWKTELSTRQVERSLLSLRKKSIIARISGGGNGRATLYRIDLSQAVHKTPYAPKAPSRSSDTIMSDDSHDTMMSDDRGSSDIIVSDDSHDISAPSSDISAPSSDIMVSASTSEPTPIKTTTTAPPTHDTQPSEGVVVKNVLSFAQSRAEQGEPTNRSKFPPDLHHKYLERHRATIRNPGGFLRSCLEGKQDAAIEFWCLSATSDQTKSDKRATGSRPKRDLLIIVQHMRNDLAQGYLPEHLRAKYHRAAMSGEEWQSAFAMLEAGGQATEGARVAV
jgi:hypothetical protein